MPSFGRARTWCVVASFLFGVSYGSFCATACALGAYPAQAHAASALPCCKHHDAGSHCPRQKIPAKQDCSTHVHPTVFVKSAAAPQVGLNGATIARVAVPMLLSTRADNSWRAASHRKSGLGPPIERAAFPPEEISILRI